MEAKFIEKEGKMSEQLDLLKKEESYNLAHLRKICRDFVKAKYPSPVDGEDYLDYLEFIQTESDLEFATRIRKIADQIEERIYGKQKEVIREVYGYATYSNQRRK